MALAQGCPVQLNNQGPYKCSIVIMQQGMTTCEH